MKFTKLNAKFDKLARKKEKGKSINPGKLAILQQLLTDKKIRYEERIKSIEDSDKRHSLETKLKVVNAQIEKSRQMIAEG
ncbi:hypothetical protein [Candidatus Spongiihabitans sp.]|uniref:hypothetical protein n=1 Tax=Candidatus Spongiihabitans sp. TaxID=3101308 RepID=UPI003C701054